MKTILNTEIVQIHDNGKEYQMLIKMSEGGIIEHNPFPRTLEGLVSALQLSVEICAGKFYPRRLVKQLDDQKDTKFLNGG